MWEVVRGDGGRWKGGEREGSSRRAGMKTRDVSDGFLEEDGEEGGLGVGAGVGVGGWCWCCLGSTLPAGRGGVGRGRKKRSEALGKMMR